MGNLTEVEIFGCMIENCRKAIEHCERLAREPRKGLNYQALRKELKLIEGACRQAGMWREDTRWHTIGMQIAQAHAYALKWVIGEKAPGGGPRVRTPEGDFHPLFMKLAKNLTMLMAGIEKTRHERTNRVGMILPVPLRSETRTQGRSVQVLLPGHHRTKAGLIVPSGIMTS